MKTLWEVYWGTWGTLKATAPSQLSRRGTQATLCVPVPFQNKNCKHVLVQGDRKERMKPLKQERPFLPSLYSWKQLQTPEDLAAPEHARSTQPSLAGTAARSPRRLKSGVSLGTLLFVGVWL